MLRASGITMRQKETPMPLILAVSNPENIGNSNYAHHEYFDTDDVDYMVDHLDTATNSYSVQVSTKTSRQFYIGHFTTQEDAVAACDALAQTIGLVVWPGAVNA